MASTILDLALTATLLTSAAFNVLQMREINRLRAPDAAPASSVFSGISAHTREGRSARISAGADGKPMLLYVFSSHCGWCVRNSESVAALASAVQARYRLVALSLDANGRQEALGRNSVPFENYARPSPEAVALYDLRATPTTLVVAADGRILRAWRGAYAGRVRTEIQRYFGVALPDVPLPG
jgi:hypothetical protein